MSSSAPVSSPPSRGNWDSEADTDTHRNTDLSVGDETLLHFIGSSWCQLLLRPQQPWNHFPFPPPRLTSLLSSASTPPLIPPSPPPPPLLLLTLTSLLICCLFSLSLFVFSFLPICVGSPLSNFFDVIKQLFSDEKNIQASHSPGAPATPSSPAKHAPSSKPNQPPPNDSKCPPGKDKTKMAASNRTQEQP